MFDDRLAVESPGTLPGLVRLNTMRNVHFSRNPKIATFLKDYGYVKEFGRGGWPDVCGDDGAWTARAGIRSRVIHVALHRQGGGSAGTGNRREFLEKFPEKFPEKIVAMIKGDPSVTTDEMARLTGLARRSVTKQLTKLKQDGHIRRVGPAKGGHWEVVGNAKEEK